MAPDEDVQAAFIRRYVDEFLPAEVDLAGDAATKDVIEAAVEGEALDIDQGPTRGRTNDIIEAIKLIFESAAFIKTVYEIYKIYRDRNKRGPTLEELIDAVQNATGRSLSSDKRAITEKVGKQLDDELT